MYRSNFLLFWFESLGNHCWPTKYPYMDKLVELGKSQKDILLSFDEIAMSCAGLPLTVTGDSTTNRSTSYRSVMGHIQWRKDGGKALYPPSAPCPLRNCKL